jgi:hypothetical protein
MVHLLRERRETADRAARSILRPCSLPLTWINSMRMSAGAFLPEIHSDAGACSWRRMNLTSAKDSCQGLNEGESGGGGRCTSAECALGVDAASTAGLPTGWRAIVSRWALHGSSPGWTEDPEAKKR